MAGAAVWTVHEAVTHPVTAATKPDVPATLLNGKTCLVVGPDDAVKTAVRDTLSAASAHVHLLSVPPSNEAAWAEALVTGANRPKADVIVNLVIPARGGGHGKIDHAEFRKIMDATYTRTFLVLKYGSRVLKANGGGALINVTSSAGTSGAPGSVARCAAAHGIVLMSRSAALVGAADFVRVNALLAGDVQYAGASKLEAGETSPEVIASAVAFLAADASKYFTGLIMPVDHGGDAR